MEEYLVLIVFQSMSFPYDLNVVVFHKDLLIPSTRKQSLWIIGRKKVFCYEMIVIDLREA
jgi:hypothetical protein